jgi:Tfp pilus assembly protein PilF
MVENERLHNALLDTLELSGSGQLQEALQLMDKLIAEVICDGDSSTALVLISHAALLNGSGRDRSLVKQYYERFLTQNPENPKVLYEAADEAMEDGQIHLAKLYAMRCYQAITRSDDAKLKRDLFDLVLERWPDVAG